MRACTAGLREIVFIHPLLKSLESRTPLPAPPGTRSCTNRVRHVSAEQGGAPVLERFRIPAIEPSLRGRFSRFRFPLGDWNRQQIPSTEAHHHLFLSWPRIQVHDTASSRYDRGCGHPLQHLSGFRCIDNGGAYRFNPRCHQPIPRSRRGRAIRPGDGGRWQWPSEAHNNLSFGYKGHDRTI